MKSTAAAAAVAIVMLNACASDLYEGKYSFREGWRSARVLKIVNGGELERPGFWACTRYTPAAQLKGTDYVTVSYRGVSRRQRRVVPLPAGLQLNPEDKVYVNLNSCDQPLVRRGTAN